VSKGAKCVNRKLFSMALLMAVIAAPPVFAHHSASAVYFTDRTAKHEGVLTKVEWINPHILVHFEVKDGAKSTEWVLEGHPPSWYRRAGVNRKAFEDHAGQMATFEVMPSRSGRPIGYFKQVTWPDGTFLRFAEDAQGASN
jgi:hypothetical protein